jgi:PleD family two-component response regulator
MTIMTSVGPVRITVSIGISGLGESVPRSSATVQSLMQHADANLYASKATGRNRVTWTNPVAGITAIRRQNNPGAIPFARTT